MRETVDDVVLVSDAQILDAMAFLSDRMKLVTEPSGAIATAALLARGRELAGRTVAVMVRGGNVGLARFCELLAGRPPWAP
jgi:threonine dehydratase